MRSAQKIVACLTLLVVAVFLFAGGHHVAYPAAMRNFAIENYGRGWHTDWGATFADCVGITLVGGVVMWLAGLRRKRETEDRKGIELREPSEKPKPPAPPAREPRPPTSPRKPIARWTDYRPEHRVEWEEYLAADRVVMNLSIRYPSSRAQSRLQAAEDKLRSLGYDQGHVADVLAGYRPWEALGRD